MKIGNQRKPAFIFFIVIAFVLILISCSSSKQIDIQHIRKNSDEYNASTTPYGAALQFKLTTQEMLDGISEPRHIETIKDTNVYLKEVRTKEKESSNEEEVFITVGLESNTKPSRGTLVSLFRLNENNTYTTGSVEFKAYTEDGTLTDAGDYGGAGGDSEEEFDQQLHFLFEKSGLLKSEAWTFEVSGLYLMDYTKH